MVSNAMDYSHYHTGPLLNATRVMLIISYGKHKLNTPKHSALAHVTTTPAAAAAATATTTTTATTLLLYDTIMICK